MQGVPQAAQGVRAALQDTRGHRLRPRAEVLSAVQQVISLFPRGVSETSPPCFFYPPPRPSPVSTRGEHFVSLIAPSFALHMNLRICECSSLRGSRWYTKGCIPGNSCEGAGAIIPLLRFLRVLYQNVPFPFHEGGGIIIKQSLCQKCNS